MRKFFVFYVLTLASVLLLWMPKAHTAANDDAEIRKLLDRWTKAFRARDLDGIMSIYEPGQALVSFDIVPPLQYTGFEAYKKDYKEFLDQFQGAIDVEYRDLNIIAGDTVAFSRGLERMTGTLKNGQKFDAWVRFTECYRKTNGHWLAIHDHISVPVDLDSGKAVLDLKP
ncbi:MAG TPA: nuclear transport factor 2 family protein [Candidatus Acidoferrum sp.]|nr:nuclear transport factor 2 family protein [Candidatus Acidoferrum sp.]